MAKFDFDNCNYAKLWDSVEGRNLITYLMNEPNMIRSNHGFYRTKFDIDPYGLPTSPDGTASFTVMARKYDKSNLMHMRAPLGDTIVREEAQAEKYSGAIKDFIADGYREQAMEREYKERLAAQLGNDDVIIAQWAANVVQRQVNDAISTLDNMAAQALSTGQVYYNHGLGLHEGVYKAPIPAENFSGAGEKPWTDPTCPLLDQMRAKEKHYKEDVFGLPNGVFQWEIPYDIYHNVMLKNQQVIDWVKERILLDRGVVLENLTIQDSDFEKYIAGFEGISRIVIVSEKQYDQETVVSGWKPNTVVFRPVGFAGRVLRTDILDEKMYSKYGSSAQTRAFGSTYDGLFLLMNTTLNNGNLKEWHTDLMMSAVPVLEDFLYHVIVDITKAD